MSVRMVTEEEKQKIGQCALEVKQNRYTNCESIREIYRLAQDITDIELREKIIDKCRESMVLAKRVVVFRKQRDELIEILKRGGYDVPFNTGNA